MSYQLNRISVDRLGIGLVSNGIPPLDDSSTIACRYRFALSECEDYDPLQHAS